MIQPVRILCLFFLLLEAGSILYAKSPAVRTALVPEPEPVPVRLSFAAKIVNLHQSSLSLEEGGKVLYAVESGEKVRSGGILIQIDPTLLDLEMKALSHALDEEAAALAELTAGARREEIERARHEFQVATTQFHLAERNLKRIEQSRSQTSSTFSEQQEDEARSTKDVFLYQTKLSKAKLEELETGARPEKILAQESRVRKIQTQIAHLKERLSRLTLRACEDLDVLEAKVTAGMTAQAGTPVLLVNPGAKNMVLMEMFGPGLPEFSDSTGFQVQSLHSKRAATARLYRKNQGLRFGRILQEIWLSLDQAEEFILGEQCTVFYNSTLLQSGLRVPLSSLRAGEKGLFEVFVVKSNQGLAQVELREVIPLGFDMEFAWVRGNLQVAEQLVVQGAQRLAPAMAVELVP